MLGIHPKVQNAGLVGAASAIIIWAAKAYGGQDIPPEIASAITTVLMSLTGYASKGAE